MVQCDEKRQKNVEALAAFRRGELGDKAWTNCGSFFLKLPASTAQRIIQQDQASISEEIDDTRAGVKADVAELLKFRPSDLDSPSLCAWRCETCIPPYRVFMCRVVCRFEL